MTETDLLHLMIERCPGVLPGVRMFRRNVGRFRSFEGKRVVHVGIKGQADAWAHVPAEPWALVIEIEAKSATGDEREAQERWREHCARSNVPHMLIRAERGELPDETVSRWLEELRTVIAALTRKTT